jgi:PAS domain-containing protein
VERVYATGEAVIEHEAERRWDRGNGVEERRVDLVIQPLRDEDGSVNGVVSFAVDVTEISAPRRRAELLREEFNAVLDLVPSGVIVVDQVGRLVAINAAGERILRAPLDVSRPLPDQFVGRHSARHSSGEPLTAPETPLARALRGEPIAEEDYWLTRGDPPEEIHVRSSARPLRDPDGEIRGAIGVFTEV